MVCITLTGILFDKPNRKPIVENELVDVTVLVAAYNEEAAIYDTLKSLSN